MNKDNYKIYLYVNIGLFVLAGIILLSITKPNYFSEYVAVITQSISFAVIVSFFFVRRLWKCRCFYPWLVPFPNLAGDWSGYIKTTYDDSDKLIPIEVFITQDFFKITIRLTTTESRSISTAAYFPTDEDGRITHLYYSYMNTPNQDVRNRSRIHYGTVRLDLGSFPVLKMQGEYWTTRLSVGYIELRKN